MKRRIINASEESSNTCKDVFDVFADLVKGSSGSIDAAIQRTADVLLAMRQHDRLVVQDVIDSAHFGEYTEWTFEKCANYKFIVTRRERVYTGQGRTGYEIQSFGEGVWSSDNVLQQVTYNPSKVTQYSIYLANKSDTTLWFMRRGDNS